MVDDIQIYDDPCPKCGGLVNYQECPAIGCDDGRIELYDEDPFWYDPGDEMPCPDCEGHGRHIWCPTCGWDLLNKRYINGLPEAAT